MLAETFATNINFTLIATVVMSAATLGMWWDARRVRPIKLDPDPLRFEKVYPPASVKELQDARLEHGRRLDDHAKQLGDLWNTMRDENTRIRKEANDKFDAISRALGRIEGELQSIRKNRE